MLFLAAGVGMGAGDGGAAGAGTVDYRMLRGVSSILLALMVVSHYGR